MSDRTEEHRKGPAEAPVELVEFIDYQSESCAAAEKPLRQALEAFSGEVSLVVKNFPVTTEHEWAGLAALAVEAAGLQGKFWEMHDALFAAQNELSLDLIMDVADTLGLDLDIFEDDLSGAETQAAVENDLREGDSLDVQLTPTILVNGHPIEGEITFTTLSRAISFVLSTKAA